MRLLFFNLMYNPYQPPVVKICIFNDDEDCLYNLFLQDLLRFAKQQDNIIKIEENIEP